MREPDGTPSTGLVTFRLVDERGRQVHDALFAGGPLNGESTVEMVAGVYSIDLPGNVDIQSNAIATYWQRTFWSAQRSLLVPTSGDFHESTLPAPPVPVAPDPVATNLITAAPIEVPVTGLVVDAFTLASVPGTLVTVPDLTYGVKIEGKAPIVCPATANISVAGIITNMTTATNKDPDYQWLGTANLPTTVKPVAVLPAHSSGTYQLRVYSFSSVTLKVDAQPSQPAGLWVYGI